MKAIKTDIVNDKTFLAWHQPLFISNKNTANGYRLGVIHFCLFTKKTPTELIEEAREDYINRVPPWDLRHVKRAEEFITHLQTAELANNTKLNYIKGIKHFYKHNKIPLDVAYKIPQGSTEDYLDLPLLKLEDIREAVQTAGHDKFIKAYILTALSSGQGQGEIRSLKGKNLKNIINGVAVVNKTRGKTHRRYFFFIGAEALQAIKEYKPDLKDEDYIFTQKTSEKQMASCDLGTFLYRHIRKLGFNRSYFAPHRFRHYFKTVLTGNMDSLFIEYLLGHKLGGAESNYYLGNQPKMLEQYLKNQHLLTVFTSQEVLQKQYDELKRTKDDDVVTLRKKIIQMETNWTELTKLLVKEKNPQP